MFVMPNNTLPFQRFVVSKIIYFILLYFLFLYLVI